MKLTPDTRIKIYGLLFIIVFYVTALLLCFCLVSGLILILYNKFLSIVLIIYLVISSIAVWMEHTNWTMKGVGDE